MWLSFTFYLISLHLLKTRGKSTKKKTFPIPERVWGLGRARTGHKAETRLAWIKGRVAVYCFMEQVCLHGAGGTESPPVQVLVYCRAGQEARSWRILSCLPGLGSHREKSGLQSHNGKQSQHEHRVLLSVRFVCLWVQSTGQNWMVETSAVTLESPD